MVKKPLKARGGRQKQDPRTIRSERLVLRIHPDLMGVLDALSEESAISRSQLVERVLITFCNQDPRVNLDIIGRKAEVGGKVAEVLASRAAFERRWKNFSAMRAAAVGEPVEDDDGPEPPEGS